MTETVTIRASSLPTYMDCPRRFAAQTLRAELAGAGYAIRALPKSIGAHVGTAVHAGCTADAESVLATGSPGNRTEIEQRAVQSLDNAIAAEGVLWDETTPQQSTAHRQVVRMWSIYRRDVLPTIRPVDVERRVRAQHASGIVLSGQTDIVIAEPATLIDLKTGVRRSKYHAQYGAYSLLRRSTGKPVQRIEEHYVQRAPIKQDQPPPVRIDMDVSTCERAADMALSRIAADMATWMQTGNPDSWLPNPSSSLCGAKWCAAHGTEFCQFGR